MLSAKKSMPMKEIQDLPDNGNYGASASLEAEQVLDSLTP